MSLATRCTHCGTIFKVVEDQLKVSEGWVRCGRCQQVFHALPTLFDLEREAPPPRAPAAPSPPTAPAPTQAAAPAAAAAPSAPEDPRDNPPSQPSPEWAATQPFTVPGDLADEPAVTAATQAPAQPPTEAQVEPPFEPQTEPAVPEVASGPHIGPQPAPPQTRSWLAPVPATTDFDLDTAVPESEPTPPEASPAEATSTAPAAPITPGLDDIELDTNVPLAPVFTPAPEPAPTTAAAPAPAAHFDTPASDFELATDAGTSTDGPTSSSFDLVPSTEESDALDSRYLLPSERRERPAARRPSHGQDFADAEVPDDWLLDAEDELSNAQAQPAVPPAPAVAPSPAMSSMFTVLAEPSPSAQALGAPVDDPDAPADTESPPVAPAPVEADEAPATPSFVHRAQAQARWRHPAMRAALGLVALLMLALLAGQVTHQFRDLIAAHHPPMRPVLAQWCEVAGCTLQPPLRIEDLQVESLSFVRATSEGPDTYRLTVVLRNKAPIALAWPQLDLSLTDLNGAVLMRRAFDPKDASWQDSPEPQSGPGQQPPEAAPADRSTTLQWRMKIAKLQPAGYTADIFYP